MVKQVIDAYTRTRLCDKCGKPFKHDWKHTLCIECRKTNKKQR